VKQPKALDAHALGMSWLAIVTAFVLSLSLAGAAYASVYSRGLYQDGAYYLFRVAQYQGFYTFDPARTTVQVMRQAPIALLSRFTDASLVTRAQVFTFTMLALPALLCALCWFILPRDRKAWILFPIVNLLAAVSATSFEAVGEPAIATGCFWILFFLLLFRTRAIVSQATFLLLCWPAFHLHEGLFLLTPTLLAACALRARSAGSWQERVFLAASAGLIVWIFAYEFGWIIVPRVPVDRAAVLEGLRRLQFIYSGYGAGRLNLPLLTGAVALVTLIWITVSHMKQAEPLAAARSRTIAAGFVLFAVLATVVAVAFDWSFSPIGQIAARYQPVFVSLALALGALLVVRFEVPQSRWAQPAALVIVASLCVAQTVADAVATMRWRDYFTELEVRLNASSGLIPLQDLLTTGHPRRDANWKLLLAGWTSPAMSIICAQDGVVKSMIEPPPETGFRPLDPRKPDAFPPLRGVDFAPYRAALAAQLARGL
jgi:hypothetical protein